jgi:hypothetical protein
VIAISGLVLVLATVATLLGALVDAVWAYVSLTMSLLAAAVLTVGAARLTERRDG